MFDEAIKTVRSHLYERVASPLSGIFITTWCLWNYQFIIVVLSDMNVLSKITYIKHTLYADVLTSVLIGFVFPLLTTLFFIFVYPIPARFVYERLRTRQRELKEIRQRIDDETPITREEARDIRRAAFETAEVYEKEITRQANEIARLKREITELASAESNDSGSGSSAVNDGKGSLSELEIRDSRNMSVRPMYGAYGSNKKLLERTRLLLTGDQYIDHQIKEFLQTDSSFEGKKFLVLTGNGKLTVTLMPDGLSGSGIKHEFHYDPSGVIPVYAEISRLKEELTKALGQSNPEQPA